MPPPTLAVLAGEVRALLERRFDEDARGLEEALQGLLIEMLTGVEQEGLTALTRRDGIHGLKTRLARLRKHLASDSSVARAVCAHYRYGRSRARAQKEYRVSDTEWQYVDDLAREVNLPVREFYRSIDFVPEEHDWHDGLEEQLVRVEVSLDPRGLEDMLLAALECCRSPAPGKRKGREVYGVNLGMGLAEEEEVRGAGTTVLQRFHVTRSQPLLSAEADYERVYPNMKSLGLLFQATRDLFPHYSVVGEFHSHPYDCLEDLEGRRGWEPSNEDEDKDYCEDLEDMGHRPRLMFVVAIARCARPVSVGRQGGLDNTLRLSFGGCRAVVGASRILLSGRLTQRNIHLAGQVPVG
jgi:hypothetical protein